MIEFLKIKYFYYRAAGDSSDTGNHGYPMSDFLQALTNHSLSYEAEEMACHFADCYHDRLQGKLSKLYFAPEIILR